MSDTFCIADINLDIDLQTLQTKLQDGIDNWSESMQYNIVSMDTRRGKKMYKLTITNNDCGELTVIAEQEPSTGEVQFHPLIMQSINNSFYSTSFNDNSYIGTDYDPRAFFCTTMRDLVITNHGTFAYISPNGTKEIISNGSIKNVTSIGLIDNDNNVYCCSGSKRVNGGVEDSSFTVNMPIGEWLAEHSDIKQAIAGIAEIDKKMNYIAKWLIQARLNDDIESDEFMDIFRQAGVIGLSDQSVLNIYKLLM